MTPCDGTERSLKWCCGVNTECCNDPAKYKLLPFEFRGALPNTASGTPRPFTNPATATPTSPTSTPTSLQNNNSNNNNNGNGGSGGLSTGAKAGIGVGAAVGGLILIALGFIIARKTSRKAAPEDAKTRSEEHTSELSHSGESRMPSSA